MNELETRLHNDKQIHKAKDHFNKFNSRIFASMAIDQKGGIYLFIAKDIDEQDLANNLRKLADEFELKGGK
ncbi:MAG: hypothetical protein ACXVDV_20030 [Bacteroidia bacterium]